MCRMQRQLNFAIGSFLKNAIIVSRRALKLGLLKMPLLLSLVVQEIVFVVASPLATPTGGTSESPLTTPPQLGSHPCSAAFPLKSPAGC
ncbi:hypothetical protein ACFX1T_038143 [Malus domestica]